MSKELLPIMQVADEEAAAVGITELVFITERNKRATRD
jgi:UTP-glucose-1-phosphate uridylyltransferase